MEFSHVQEKIYVSNVNLRVDTSVNVNLRVDTSVNVNLRVDTSVVPVNGVLTDASGAAAGVPRLALAVQFPIEDTAVCNKTLTS